MTAKKLIYSSGAMKILALSFALLFSLNASATERTFLNLGLQTIASSVEFETAHLLDITSDIRITEVRKNAGNRAHQVILEFNANVFEELGAEKECRGSLYPMVTAGEDIFGNEFKKFELFGCY